MWSKDVSRQRNTRSILRIEYKDIEIFAGKDTLGSDFEQGTQLHCLALNYTQRNSASISSRSILQGLLLEPIPGSSDEYTRIGYFIIFEQAELEIFGVRLGEGRGHAGARTRRSVIH